MNEQILDQEAENTVRATAQVLGLNESSLPALRVLYATGRMAGALEMAKIDWNVRSALGLPAEGKPS